MILAFDTCQSACSVSLGENGSVRAHAWEAMGRGHAERLLPMIEEVLAEAGATKRDLTRVLVTTGPGTFAGQRVGIAAARGLGLALKVEVVGLTVTELIAAAWAARNEAGPDSLLVIFDARRNEAYVQNFARAGGKAHPLDDVRMINLDDLADHLPDAPYSVAGTGQDFVPEARPTDLILPDAKYAIAMSNDLHPEVNRLPRPLYLRPPDAELPKDRPRQRADMPNG